MLWAVSRPLRTLDEMDEFDAVMSASEFGPNSAPPEPGLYAWLRDGVPVFWGAAHVLRKRLWMMEANGPMGPKQSKSPLRERVALRLLRDEGAQFRWRRDPERRRQVDQWLAACDVGWRLMPFDSADQELNELLDVDVDRLPLLHRWRPRPGEDELLEQHLAGESGAVFVEVPIGGASDSADRFIDAIRIIDRPSEMRYYHRGRFARQRADRPLEIIEVKKSLNRTVVGQLIVGRDLVRRGWGGLGDLDAVAVVGRDDVRIRRLCEQEYGIRVEVVEG